MRTTAARSEYFAPHLLPLAIAGGRAEEEDEDDDDDDDDDTGGVGEGCASEEDYWERRINQVVSGAPAVDSGRLGFHGATL